MDALIVFSHGSLLCGSGEALDSHVARLRALGHWSMVEAGYLNYTQPTFLEAAERCREAGATRIVVVPYFLVPGYFVSQALPKQIEAVRAIYPELTFFPVEPLGFDERLAQAIVQSSQNPLPPGQWREGISSAGRACRARFDCPLYGTPDCPRAPSPGSPARPFLE